MNAALTVQFPGYRAKVHRVITIESAEKHRQEHTTVKLLESLSSR